MGRIGCCSDSTLLDAIEESSSVASVAAKGAENSAIRIDTELIGHRCKHNL